MGGRGGASGFPSNAPVAPQPPVVPAGPTSAAETHDLQELHDYMKTLGMNVDMSSLAGQTFENVREAASGIEQVMQEFPQAVGSFRRLRGMTLKKGELANASYNGAITLANYFYSKSTYGLDATYQQTLFNKFHPAGTKKIDIATHESGHILETALIHKYLSGSTYADKLARANAWNNCTMASKVVHEAVTNLKKTPTGKGKLTNDFIRDVSKYATKNRSETLAECVADYSRNGANAKPLSVEVWKILKRELG
jgi:hypothetical protein